MKNSHIVALIITVLAVVAVVLAFALSSGRDASASDVESCIITIDGEQYDVTEHRKSHTGGDIFLCGEDMTKLFFSQHDTKHLREQLEKYKVSQ